MYDSPVNVVSENGVGVFPGSIASKWSIISRRRKSGESMKIINIKTLIRLISLMLLIVSCFFIGCIPVALIYSEPVKPFVLSTISVFVPGLLLLLTLGKGHQENISIKEGYLGVTLCWLTLSLSGTLPYFFSDTIPGFTNRLFETVSGFTTTGASILTDIEALPKSILFWRSLTHWIGGIGIILLVIIILPTLKIGGYNLFSLESSMKEKILPKTKSIAKIVLMIYLALTLSETILLSFGGMDIFDSLCHSFGTVATGGFSTKNTSIAGFSPYIQYVIAIFMFLSATSYVVFYYLIKGNLKKIRINEELGLYVFITTACISVVTIILYVSTDSTFELSFRHASFQVISQISCTGFATTDYMAWPAAGWFLMFIIMFAGGSTGSTTGGIKMARHLILLKNLRLFFMKLTHPNAVLPVRLNGKILTDSMNMMMIGFILLYMLIFLIGTTFIIFAGMSPLESAGASATCMAGIGPGLGQSGNMGNYAHFTQAAKTGMVVLMLVGRLEIFTMLALFTRSFWRK